MGLSHTVYKILAIVQLMKVVAQGPDTLRTVMKHETDKLRELGLRIKISLDQALRNGAVSGLTGRTPRLRDRRHLRLPAGPCALHPSHYPQSLRLCPRRHAHQA